MEGYSDAELVVRVGRLQDVEDYDEECATCQKPNLLHNGACVRSEKVEEEELLGIWKEFRIKMKVVMKNVREEREKRLWEVEITKDWKNVMREMNAWNNENIERLCGVLVRSREESARQPSKVIKPAKVPTY